MAATAPEIRVFASFPLDTANTEPSNWNWVHCLTFPLDTLDNLQFMAPKPYKWIRYATGVVIGAQGDLSFSRGSPHDVMDYDHDLRAESADLYYHTSDAEKQKMFPADPDMDRTSVTSNSEVRVTARRSDFHSDLVERDGVCALSGYSEELCDAVHLLPHSKGDEYIETYTRHRSRDPAGSDIVFEIDDIRNGILLNVIAHCTIGKDIAFLMTPNFAMTTTDVDPAAPLTEKRCTAHLFVPNEPQAFGDPRLRSGHQVRMPDTADEWPPDILFDAIYANAVLRHFATQTMRDTLVRWKFTFCPRVITSAAQASDQAIIDQRRKEQSQAREQRDALRANRPSLAGEDDIDYYDCLLILPYLMVPPDKREEVWRKAAEKRAEKERSRVEDKVVGWARDVANACP